MSAIQQTCPQATERKHPATIQAEEETEAFFDLLFELTLAAVTLDQIPTHD